MADERPTPAPGVRALLRIPDFRRLYVAQAVSDIGDGMTFLALYLLVLELTGSMAALALLAILVALPPVTIGLFAGAWADRSDRRRIMVVSDALRAVVVLGLVPAAMAGSLPVILVLALVQSVIGTFFAPARTAIIPRVVPEEGLLAANSLQQMTRMVAGVVGVGLTGVIAAASSTTWMVFVVDAATFLVSVLVVLRVSAAAGRPEARTVAAVAARGMAGAVMDGLRLIARSAALTAALGGVAVTMLGLGAINVLFVPYLVGDLAASPAWAGPLEAAQTVGMVLAGAMLAALAARVSVTRLFVGGLVGMGVAVGLMALVPGPLLLLPVMFAAGALTLPVQASTMTIVQQGTTDATRGRVAGALNAGIQAASIGSMAAAGILADAVGIRSVFLAGAAVTLLAAVVAWGLFRRSASPAAAPDRTPEPTPA